MAKSQRRQIGWREWVALPELGISAIKAKVDTGARSSALHAFDLHLHRRDGVDVVRFKVHPLQRDYHFTIEAEHPLVDERAITSSSGHTTLRPVIMTSLRVYDGTWPIELTLTNRDEMGFRMLLGRSAVRGRFLIDPGASFLSGKPPSRGLSSRGSHP